MPRYFFDVVDGGPHRDDTGSECATLDEVRDAAIQVLPDIAREQIRADGDRRFFTVVARDEEGRAIYTATLGFAGLWLHERP
ncbi:MULTISPECIES: DUF6894 family protein [Methylobacterium]|uniref:DUF6894 family protein n=1 Tax=Methylobacterium TaxID=407 RepID=UPI001052D6A9|nr:MULTISPECIES: hypothetical protein [Methylobacterium]MDR7037054.1 hypothetical protein [Methylobacterium sp. BE186]